MNANDHSGPGAKSVGVIGIAIMIGYLTLFAALLLYLLVALWPIPTPSGEPPPGENRQQQEGMASAPLPPAQRVEGASPKRSSPLVKEATGDGEVQNQPIQPVVVFGWRWDIADEVRLLMLVICAGALGSLVHGLRSIYWYVGNRVLIWSWIPKYLLLPFSGSVLAVVFYFVVRGGFFSPRAGFQQTSPFGFAALAAMVGMFSEQAVLKLKEIAETLLSKPPQGKNAEPQGEG